MIKRNKFKIFINKTILGKLIKFNEKTNKKLIKGQMLKMNYFYWWYKELYNFRIIGLLVKKKRKFEHNSLNLTLFYIIKNVRVNQTYANTSPFITFIKKRINAKKKLIKSLYIL